MRNTIHTAALAGAMALGLIGVANAQTTPAQPSGQNVPNPTKPPVVHQGAASQGNTKAGQGKQNITMGEEQVRTALRARGYTDISGLTHDGGMFKVNKAKRYGENVKGLTFNAQTGEVTGEQRLSESQVKQMLQHRGYSNVNVKNPKGDVIGATAKLGDTKVELQIDPYSAAVRQRSAAN